MQLLLSDVETAPVRFSKFAGSFLAHVVLLVAIGAFSRYAASEADDIDWSRFHAEPLRLHESIPVFFAPAAEKASMVGGGATVANAAGTSGPTVLEPEYLREAKLPATVPPLAHWSRIAPADAPKPTPRQIITPGRVEAESSGLRTTANPSLSVPNRETAAGDQNISLQSANTPNSAAVTFANSSTTPIQALNSLPAAVASFDISTGQPVNVLALSENRTVQPYVEIPRGLQNVAGGGREYSAAGGNSRSDASRLGRSGTAGPPTPAPDSADSAVGPEAPKAFPSAAGDRALPESELKRVNHPRNGSYDVVVAQSVTLHNSPALSSNSGPVYTVYLPVGDEKEWLLEFCGAAAPSVPQSAYHVTVGDEDSIVPPYPISTVIPTKLLSTRSTGLVINGLLTSAGRLINFRLQGPVSAAGETILKLLEEWIFRPATRNRTNIDVDVLLIIPPPESVSAVQYR